MILTTEQRESFLVLIGVIEAKPRSSFVDESVDIIRNLLSGSKPAWEATDERQATLGFLLSGEFKPTCPCKHCVNVTSSLRTMLEEARQ